MHVNAHDYSLNFINVSYSLLAQFRHLRGSLALQPKYARNVAHTLLDTALIVCL